MKLFIGLGNPGRDYEKTRHNVGYMVIDKLSQILNSKSKNLNKSQIQIFKSGSFMNDSGDFVSQKLKAYGIKPEALYVIHDDLDIPLGSYKIQFGKGPKDHNGILSIEEKLETKNFWRVRVGVENRAQRSEPSGKKYVLQNFTDDEILVLGKVTEEICEKLKKI